MTISFSGVGPIIPFDVEPIVVPVHSSISTTADGEQSVPANAWIRFNFTSPDFAVDFETDVSWALTTNESTWYETEEPLTLYLDVPEGDVVVAAKGRASLASLLRTKNLLETHHWGYALDETMVPDTPLPFVGPGVFTLRGSWNARGTVAPRRFTFSADYLVLRESLISRTPGPVGPLPAPVAGGRIPLWRRVLTDLVSLARRLLRP